MGFQKGKLYMLKGLSRNKHINGMVNLNGELYVCDTSRGWYAHGQSRTYADGDVFACLSDTPDFDPEAIVERLDGDITSMRTLKALEQAKAQYDMNTKVTMLSPDGQVVRMRIKGNKTKFKMVTDRTRKK
tara:strand:- start:1609 stop:1998 length:390 start_codon:yes stop_codon:yes gene_type:complete